MGEDLKNDFYLRQSGLHEIFYFILNHTKSLIYSKDIFGNDIEYWLTRKNEKSTSIQ